MNFDTAILISTYMHTCILVHDIQLYAVHIAVFLCEGAMHREEGEFDHICVFLDVMLQGEFCMIVKVVLFRRRMNFCSTQNHYLYY